MAGIDAEIRGRKAGFVLVSVLWIMAILTVVSLGFARRAMMERKVAWYAMDHAQALQMARGACERAAFELIAKPQIDLSLDQGGFTGFEQRWARPVDLFAEADYFEAGRNPEFDRDVCQYRVWDCDSRININAAPEEVLHEIDGLTATHVRKIMARRQREGEEMDGMNARFTSPEELRTFLEIDADEWFGESPGQGIRDKLAAWGDGRVNLNTASRGVLESLPDLDDDVIDGIMTYRMGNDGILGNEDDRSFRTVAELATALQISAEKLTAVDRFCKTQSTYFTIDAFATRRQGKVLARCSAVVQLGGFRPVIQWSEDTIGS